MAITRVYNEALLAKQTDAKVTAVEIIKITSHCEVHGAASDEEIGAALQDFAGAWERA